MKIMIIIIINGEIMIQNYKTGDIVRYLENGDVEYIGRIDNQIKLRGLRIEIDEIENEIFKNENISNCCIILKEDESNENGDN
jgi:acyl-coenzyme A synthetase/AMP-(fatty) acid ligase